MTSIPANTDTSHTTSKLTIDKAVSYHSMSLNTLDPLKPVHHLILDILKREIPRTMICVSEQLHEETIPILYEKVYLNPWNCLNFIENVCDIFCDEARSVKFLSLEDEDTLLSFVRSAFRIMKSISPTYYVQPRSTGQGQDESDKLFPNLAHLRLEEGMISSWGNILDDYEMRFPQQQALLKSALTLRKYCNLQKVCFEFPKTKRIYSDIADGLFEPMWDSIFEGIYHFTQIDTIRECTYHLHHTDFIDRFIRFPMFDIVTFDILINFKDNNNEKNTKKCLRFIKDLVMAYNIIVNPDDDGTNEEGEEVEGDNGNSKGAEHPDEDKNRTIKFLLPDFKIWRDALDNVGQELEGKFDTDAIEHFKNCVVFHDDRGSKSRCECHRETKKPFKGRA